MTAGVAGPRGWPLRRRRRYDRRAVTRLPRILAGLAAALSASLLASACSAQPGAASVDGTSINASSLNAELAQLSANRAYIKAVNRASAQAGQQVSGAARGTYNSLWTAHVLTGLITADAVGQYLHARGQQPSAYQVEVARAVEAADYGPYWQGFSASYRDTLTQRAAELAQVGAPGLPATELRSAYKQLGGYLFTRVCVRAPVFATRGAAEAYASTVSSGSAAPGHGSAAACYTPAQLDVQPAAFTNAVRALPVNGAGRVVATSSGYEVVLVTSRKAIPLDLTLRRTLDAVVASGSGAAPQVRAVLSRSKVTVNPQYGSWKGSATQGYQVVPPRAPGA